MKTLLISITIILNIFSYTKVNYPVVLYDGFYYGKNIYIENPLSEEKVGYSVITIHVNDRLITDHINSHIIEINFSKLQIKLGEPIQICIKHKQNAIPTILNPEDIKKQNFMFKSTSQLEKLR